MPKALNEALALALAEAEALDRAYGEAERFHAEQFEKWWDSLSPEEQAEYEEYEDANPMRDGWVGRDGRP